MPLLLQVFGAGWNLEIIGKLPELPPFISTAPESVILAEGVLGMERRNASSNLLQPVASGEAMEPLFFEAVTYDIHFEKRDPTATLMLPPGAEARRVSGDAEHHQLNFGNNVGFAEIAIASRTGPARLKLEVFSRKVDYRSDYIAMRDEVSAMLRNLAMATTAKTYGLAAPANGNYATLVEWFALLQDRFEAFMQLASSIARAPHNSLERKTLLVDTERARHVSRQAISRALRGRNSGPVHPSLGVALPRRIGESGSSLTVDTPENRYFKALLKATYLNIRALSAEEGAGAEDVDPTSDSRFFASIRQTLAGMEHRLESLLQSPILKQVGEASLSRPESMVLHKHPLYSRFDRLCRILNGGLRFSGDLVAIGVKDTAQLYEYWSFLRLVGLLGESFDLESQSVVQVNRLRTIVALAKGKSSALRFKHKPTGKLLYVVYNRLFNRLPTVAQQPDNLIQFSSNERFYIFDAKYRIQFDRPYMDLYGGPGPMTEDVNTMHRYRDAIAIPHPETPGTFLRGVVAGAVVLFPYPDEATYRTHKFFKSIDQVEIGGLPFSPNSTALVREKLHGLLAAEYPPGG